MALKLKLTEEGLSYLKKGLPEINLANLLKRGNISIDEAGKKVENFAIALQWAKKNGWVEIKEGKLIPVKQPDASLQNALKDVESGKVSEDLLKVLIFRKLLKEDREDDLKKAEAFIGKEIDKLTPELVKTGLWAKTKIRPYNVEFVGKKIYPGKRQPYNQFLERVRTKLIELGFDEIRGQSIIQEFWNFDALYQPQNHPSRDWTETYSLKEPKYGNLPDPKLVDRVKEAHENGGKTGSTGWGYTWNPKTASKLMPVAHDTAISPKTLSMKNLKVPGKYFQVVRCFRPDVLDATHLIEFNQTGGFVVGENLSFRNLLGVLEMFAKEVAGATQVKFLPDYYPFTEMSVQMSAKHPELGWVEFGGAGMFREEMTKPLGVDAPCIAWGIGIDRLAMFKLGIKDIRYLFSTDLKWLRESEMVF